MAFNFSESAKKATADSFIIEGREKALIESLIPAYPNGMTVIMAEVTRTIDEKTGEPKDYCRLVFAEEPKKYVNGGSAFTKVVNAWMADGGFTDCEEMSKALESAGGVKVKMTTTRLKNGNNYTVVTVI